MGQIKVDAENKLTITYGGLESPFGTLDGSRSAPFIKPNNFTALNNFISVDGELATIGWTPVQLNAITVALPAGATNIQILFVTDIKVTTNVPSASTNPYVHVIGVTYNTPGTGSGQISNFTIIENRISVTNSTTFTVLTGIPIVATSPGPGGAQSTLSTATFKIINGQMYISGPDFITVLLYTPQVNPTMASTLVNLAPTQGSQPIGAIILTELDSHLVMLGTQSALGLYSTLNPNQIAWSAPFNYAQFEPLVGGLETGAGYTNLPDVEDAITGVINSGPTAMIIRENGLTEMIPLNSGIQPFDFQHISVSHKGDGSFFTSTVAQYGTLGAYLTENGITLTATGSFTQGICGVTWEVINRVINNLNINQIQLFINAIEVDDKTYPALVLLIAAPPQQLYTFIGDINAGVWGEIIGLPFQSTFTGTAILGQSNAKLIPGDTIGVPQSRSVLLTYSSSGVNLTFNTYFMQNKSLFAYENAPSGNLPSIVFPVEQVVNYSEVTIDSIVVWLNDYNTVGKTLTFSINGTLFGPLVTLGVGLNMYTLYPVTLPFTGKNPQLTVTQTSLGSVLVANIIEYGTVVPQQRP